jgi:DNA polymerase-3 subunit delta
MITTLTGDNSFGWQQAAKHTTDSFVAEFGDLAVEKLDGEETSFERLRESLVNLPFLASKKLVVLRAPSANKQFLDKAETLLQDVPENVDVVLIEPKLDKRIGYYKFLKKDTDFKEFSELDVNGLTKWLTEAAKSQKGSISPVDARYLIDRVGASQQLLANELTKLLTYNPSITREQIDLLTDATPQSTIFQLLEAAFNKRTKQALEIYAEQRAMKVEPQQIIAMLTWQLNVLAIIKTAGDRTPDDIAKEAKISPFVVKRSLGIANKLSLAELKKLIANLLELDIKSKTISIDVDEALQNYLVSMAYNS